MAHKSAVWVLIVCVGVIGIFSTLVSATSVTLHASTAATDGVVGVDVEVDEFGAGQVAT